MAQDPDPPFDTPQGRPHDPVEKYFEQLDTALATRPAGSQSLGASATPTGTDTVAEVPTLGRVLAARVEPPTAGDIPAAAAAAPSLVADAFSALVALEEGEPGAKPVRPVTGDEEPRVTEALLEELTRRIIARLAPDVAREMVVHVVSEVAERLIKDEIERIRNKHA